MFFTFAAKDGKIDPGEVSVPNIRLCVWLTGYSGSRHKLSRRLPAVMLWCYAVLLNAPLSLVAAASDIIKYLYDGHQVRD